MANQTLKDLLKELDDELALYAKRRSELRLKQVETESSYQEKLDAMTNAILEDSSTRALEGYKRDIAALEVTRTALEAAVTQVDDKIGALTRDVMSQKRAIAEAEIISIADGVQARIRDTIALIYAAAADVNLLKQDYAKAKALAEPLGITTAVLLSPEQFESLETVKWLMALELPHRLSVLKRNHPSMARDDLETVDVEMPPTARAPVRY